MAKIDSTPTQLPLPIQDNPPVQVPLTRGFVAIVDAVDADVLEHLWYASPLKGYEYARRHLYEGKKQLPNVFLHRVILERVIGRPLVKGEFTDHINGDPLDNRRSNLRVVTHQQNMANRKHAAHSKYRLKGVQLRHGKWRAKIQVNGKRIELGSFDTEEEAHQAYCEAAKSGHGEFANSGD